MLLKCRVARKNSLCGSKITHLPKKVFGSTFGFSILLLSFLHTLLLGQILLFGCWIFPTLSGCQTVWTQMTFCSGLIWGKPVCKGYQQTTKVANSGQRVQNNFLIQQFFHLAKQILSQSKPWLYLPTGYFSCFFVLCWFFFQNHVFF